MRGTYLLLIEMKKDTDLRIGALGTYHFHNGWYAYVGSALNGLDQRIQRHLRSHKKIHWHIDYLLKHARIAQIFYRENTIREECVIAQQCNKMLHAFPGFGCSDCSCSSHLFSGSYEEISQRINTLGIKLYIFSR